MIIRVTTQQDVHHADKLCEAYAESAKQRGTGIAKREPEYLIKKMINGDAVIAMSRNGDLAGFCYIETFDNKKFVVNSGLLILPEFRKYGIGKMLKNEVFALSRTKYPLAKIFGITTSLAVMKINSDLGYKPVTFSEITDSEDFWKGCKSCKNYHILTENERQMCLCTGMVYDKLDDKYTKNNTNNNTEK